MGLSENELSLRLNISGYALLARVTSAVSIFQTRKLHHRAKMYKGKNLRRCENKRLYSPSHLVRLIGRRSRRKNAEPLASS